jgi:hypothetical protein
LAATIPVEISIQILITFAMLRYYVGCLKQQAEIKPNEPVRVMPERERSKQWKLPTVN